MSRFPKSQQRRRYSLWFLPFCFALIEELTSKLVNRPFTIRERQRKALHFLSSTHTQVTVALLCNRIEEGREAGHSKGQHSYRQSKELDETLNYDYRHVLPLSPSIRESGARSSLCHLKLERPHVRHAVMGEREREGG